MSPYKISFIIIFFITNILFSGIIACGLIRLNNGKTISNVKIALLSLGFGPAATASLLYWLLFLFPRKPDKFYFASIILFYSIIFLIATADLILKKGFSLTETGLKIKYLLLSKRLRWKFLFLATVAVGIMVSLFPIANQYLNGYLRKPLIGHDILAYGTEGKIYYEEKTLKFKYDQEYPKSGFTNFSKHSPLFPLLLTWEKIAGHTIGDVKDYYFKSITPFFGLLIIGLVFTVLSLKNSYLALMGSVALFSSSIFFMNFCRYHIDLFRIFFFTAGLVFFAASIETKDRMNILLCGITLGFSAASHSIGAIVSCFSVLVFFLFYDEKIEKRVKYSTLLISMILILGGFHYLYDTIWGTGWIL